MLHIFIKGTTYVFIDAENIFYSQRTLGWKISYQRFMEYFKKECGDDVRCFMYKGIDESNIKQREFLEKIKAIGYSITTKSLKKIKGRDGKEYWKNNLDIELALDMVEMKHHYHTAILLSGDSDFAVAIDRIKQVHKRIIVISTRGHIAKELLERAKYIDLRKLKDWIIEK